MSRQQDKKVLFFPTKDHWKDPSKYEYIDSGLSYFAKNYKALKITSCAFPRIGCGLGGLDWEKVKALLEKHLGDLDIEIEVYV